MTNVHFLCATDSEQRRLCVRHSWSQVGAEAATRWEAYWYPSVPQPPVELLQAVTVMRNCAKLLLNLPVTQSLANTVIPIVYKFPCSPLPFLSAANTLFCLLAIQMLCMRFNNVVSHCSTFPLPHLKGSRAFKMLDERSAISSSFNWMHKLFHIYAFAATFWLTRPALSIRHVVP